MRSRKLTILAIVAVFGTTFLGLAWRAEWIPRVIAREDLADQRSPEWQWTCEVRRQRVSRNWLTLFSSETEPLKIYECRILYGSTLVTAVGSFFEAAEPETVKFSWRGPDEILFDFGGGSGNYVCKFIWGLSANWARPDATTPSP